MNAAADAVRDRRIRELSDRYGFHLVRWTRGRTPEWARGAVDPVDVVEEALAAVADALPAGVPVGREGVLSRIRQTLLDRLLARIRSARDSAAHLTKTRLEITQLPIHNDLVGADLIKRYEQSLLRLPPHERDAVICRSELGLPWSDVTDVLEKPGVAAARRTVCRALVHLAREMADAR